MGAMLMNEKKKLYCEPLMYLLRFSLIFPFSLLINLVPVFPFSFCKDLDLINLIIKEFHLKIDFIFSFNSITLEWVGQKLY
jgi:hypothetical protein